MRLEEGVSWDGRGTREGRGVGVVKIHYTLSTDKKLKTNLGRKKESLKARQ